MKALAVLLPRGEKDAADRFYRPALAADYASHVALGYANLEPNRASILDLGNLDSVRFTYEGTHYPCYSFFHLP